MHPGAPGPLARSRPLPRPTGQIHASPSAYELWCEEHNTPPPVPPKPGREQPSTPLSKSESLRKRAEEIMERGSPSRAGHRRKIETHEQRPLPPTPLAETRRVENGREAQASPSTSPVRTSPWTAPTSTSPRSSSVRRPLPSPQCTSSLTRPSAPRPLASLAEHASPLERLARSPSPTHGRRMAHGGAPHAHAGEEHRPLATKTLPHAGTPPLDRAPSPLRRAHGPIPARLPSPLRGARPLPSSDGVFGPRMGGVGAPHADAPPYAPCRDAPPAEAAGAEAEPVDPGRAAQRPFAAVPRPVYPTPHRPQASRPSPGRPSTPRALAAPARPETPTRCRTPEGGVPRIARTPSPVRSVRPYEMTPAVPGGPPVPLILIDGEVMTDAMMDPAEPHDATVSFDEGGGPAPQHAACTSADVALPQHAHAMCRGCGKGIVGAMVRAINATWHTRCFVCAACATPLEHVSFYEHDGRPYCHLDYHELFARRCFSCQTPIVDERFVTIDDPHLGQRSYHELHFFCASCGDPFLDPQDAPSPAMDVSANVSGETAYGGKPFFVQGAHPYCEPCHTRLHKPKCQACRAPIEKEVVRALRAEWHPECFVCTRCRAPLHDRPVFSGPDGAPCDGACYQAWMRRAN